jgi:hypothetical protein
MIVDDALEMLRRVKTAVRQNAPKVQAPDPQDNASTKIGLELEVETLCKSAKELKEAFLEALSVDQRAAWDAYWKMHLKNQRIGYPDNPLYDSTAERRLKKIFKESLLPTQREEAHEVDIAYATFRKKETRLYGIENRDALYGEELSDVKEIATVFFPENFSRGKQWAIIDMFRCLAYALGQIVGHEVKFYSVDNAKQQQVGLRLEVRKKIDAQELNDCLDVIGDAVSLLRQNLSEAERWEKVKTSKGTGYRYIEQERYGHKDVYFETASSLATDYLDNRQVLWKKGKRFLTQEQFDLEKERTIGQGKPLSQAWGCIVLTGKAAEQILGNEFGIDLKEIKEARETKR